LREQTAEDRPAGVLRFLERRSRLFGLLRRIERKAGFLFGLGGWWRLNEAILDAIRADCAAAGAQLIFVHFPYKDGRTFPALSAYMKRCGAACLDLVEIWGGPRKDLYIEGDIHINAKGHRYAADVLLEWLREQ